MKIKIWLETKNQMCSIGKHSWNVARLFELSRSLPILEIPLDRLNVWYKYENLTLRDFVMHMNAVNNADLNFPIILDEDGELMDGRHRLMKAMLNGCKTIKAVRFDENPWPCRVED
jgi:hypothetical protein